MAISPHAADFQGFFLYFFDFFVQEDIQNSKGSEGRKIPGFLCFRGFESSDSLAYGRGKIFVKRSFLSFKTALIFPKSVREKFFPNFRIPGIRKKRILRLLPEGSNNALLTNLENFTLHAWPATRAQAVTEDATSGGVVGRPTAHVEIA